MRFIGHYPAANIPSFVDLAQASSPARRADLSALAGRVRAAGKRHTAARPDLHLTTKSQLTAVQKKILQDGYDYRSSAVKKSLEEMRLSLSADHRELCPYCSLESTYQLDHFLPKTRYPEFSLYGPNLLPICGRCNQIKLNSIVNAASERIFLVPSDDGFMQEDLLLATLNMDPTPHFTFRVDPGAPLSYDERSQVQRHFERLQLADRYARRANALLDPLLKSVKRNGSKPRVARKLIASGLRSAAGEGPNNSWKLAMYRAILKQRKDFKAWLLA